MWITEQNLLELSTVGTMARGYGERQQKMHSPQKKCGRMGCTKNGAGFWVEMKKDGLKTAVKSGILYF